MNPTSPHPALLLSPSRGAGRVDEFFFLSFLSALLSTCPCTDVRGRYVCIVCCFFFSLSLPFLPSRCLLGSISLPSHMRSVCGTNTGMVHGVALLLQSSSRWRISSLRIMDFPLHSIPSCHVSPIKFVSQVHARSFARTTLVSGCEPQRMAIQSREFPAVSSLCDPLPSSCREFYHNGATYGGDYPSIRMFQV
jgi:hypothetical protein